MAQGLYNDFTVDPDNGVISVEFFDGQKIKLDVNAQSEGNKRAALYHGYKQKLADGGAVTVYGKGADGAKTKRPGTLAEKKAGVLKVFDVLSKGTGEAISWRAVRESGDKSLGLLDIQTNALVAYAESIGKPKPWEVVRAKLKSMSHADRAKFCTSPAVLPFFQAAQGVTDADSVDAEGLFD